VKEAEVRSLLEAYGGSWEMFIEWMKGQTVSGDPETGETIYYPWDVAKFVRGLLNEKNYIDTMDLLKKLERLIED
jgi:hypothetical protein